jgi:hypothetical protein
MSTLTFSIALVSFAGVQFLPVIHKHVTGMTEKPPFYLWLASRIIAAAAFIAFINDISEFLDIVKWTSKIFLDFDNLTNSFDFGNYGFSPGQFFIVKYSILSTAFALFWFFLHRKIWGEDVFEGFGEMAFTSLALFFLLAAATFVGALIAPPQPFPIGKALAYSMTFAASIISLWATVTSVFEKLAFEHHHGIHLDFLSLLRSTTQILFFGLWVYMFFINIPTPA